MFCNTNFIIHRVHLSYPTRRSSDLPQLAALIEIGNTGRGDLDEGLSQRVERTEPGHTGREGRQVPQELAGADGLRGPCGDRKSTRLNSSHTVNSYAVFCLKKNIS